MKVLETMQWKIQPIEKIIIEIKKINLEIERDHKT